MCSHADCSGGTDCSRLSAVLLSLSLVLAALGLSACKTAGSAPSARAGAEAPTRAAPAPPAPSERELTVFAAASLTRPFDRFIEAYEASHPGLKVQASYDGTQVLCAQMEQGARPDVFASASKEDMERMLEAGLVKEPAVFARNILCVALCPGSRAKSLDDLAKPGMRVVVATRTCPVGGYTHQCWAKMSGDQQFGPDFVAALEKNVVSEETNVKLVMAKVELGEADAGFAYRTDLCGSKATPLLLPPSVSVEATYDVGIGTQASNEADARAFIQGLLGREGRKSLAAESLMLPERQP